MTHDEPPQDDAEASQDALAVTGDDGTGNGGHKGGRKHKPISPSEQVKRRRRQLASAAVLRVARDALNKSQAEVAEEAHISSGHYARMESVQGTQRYDMTVLRLWNILDALGMTWAQWEREVDYYLAHGATAKTTKMEMLARIVRGMPEDQIDILIDLARALERHQTGLLNTSDTLRVRDQQSQAALEAQVGESERRLRRSGMHAIADALTQVGTDPGDENEDEEYADDGDTP